MKFLLTMTLACCLSWSIYADIFFAKGDVAPDAAHWQLANPKLIQPTDGKWRYTRDEAAGIYGNLVFARELPSYYEAEFDVFLKPELLQKGCLVFFDQAANTERPYWYVELFSDKVACYYFLNGQWQYGGDRKLPNVADPAYRFYVIDENKTARIQLFRLDNGRAGEKLWETELRHDRNTPGRLNIGTQYTSKAAFDLANWRYADMSGAPGDFPVWNQSQSAGTLKSQYITASVQNNGAIFLQRPGENEPFGCFQPTMQSIPQLEPLALTLSMNELKDNRVTQEWRDAAGNFALEITATPGDGPWLTVNTGVKNLRDQAARVQVTYDLAPTAKLGKLTDRIAFRKKWIQEVLPVQEPIRRLEENLSWTWGTLAFCYPKEILNNADIYTVDPITGAMVLASRSPVDAYVPLVSVSNPRGGLTLSVNPRAAFLFNATPDGASVSHIYYLPAEKDFVDRGFFDGSGEADYTVYAGYPEKNDWGYLWKNYYCAQNPWLRSGPEPVTIVSGEILDNNPQPEYYRLLEESGVNQFGSQFLSFFRRPEEMEKIMKSPEIEFARKNDYILQLWTNIFMAPDLDGHGRCHDPNFDYRNFKDSWVCGVDGKPLPNWDGFMCTPSPKYSFAKFEFDRMIKYVKQFNLDGIFLDLYAFNPDVDWNRSYAHLPFYPLQTATIEYVQMISDWCQKNGKIFTLNCPHPSLMVWHLANNYQGDTSGPHNDISLIERLSAAAAGRTHTLLAPITDGDAKTGEWLRVGLDAIFYGEVPAPWRVVSRIAPEKMLEVGWLFGRNRQVIKMVAEAEIAGGNLENSLWFGGADGKSGFITLRNRGNEVLFWHGRLSDRVALAPGRYQAILWDLVSPPSVLDSGDETLAAKDFQVMLAPGRTQVLLFVDDETAQSILADGAKIPDWK